MPGTRPARRAPARAYRPKVDRLDARVLLSLTNPAAPPALAGIINQPAIMNQVIPQPPGSSQPASTQGSTAPVGFSPQQIQTAYGLGSISWNGVAGTGAGQTIAIVDAYDDPYLVDSGSNGFATSDLGRFDQAFHLPPPPSFIKIGEYGGSTLPMVDPAGAGVASGNWETEEALDVEWAHAIAPMANLVLIECNSGNSADLYQGVRTARALAGVTVVSMSWGSPEYASETTYDSLFTTPAGHVGITFVAATGDQGAPGEYPAYSPNVVAAGGTTLNLGPGGVYQSETEWTGSGGGASAFESEPTYQRAVQTTGQRTTPDVAFDANPQSGVAVVDQYNNSVSQPWEEIGGTSLAAPAWAAFLAIVDQGRTANGGRSLDGPTQTLPLLYGLGAGAFHTVGTEASGGAPGYNEQTGLGSPNAVTAAQGLVGISEPGPAPALRLALTAAPPEMIVAGQPFGLSIAIETGSGVVDASYQGTATVELVSAVSGSLLSGPTSQGIENGQAWFTGLNLNEASAADVLVVTVGDLSVATPAFTVIAPAAGATPAEQPHAAPRIKHLRLAAHHPRRGYFLGWMHNHKRAEHRFRVRPARHA